MWHLNEVFEHLKSIGSKLVSHVQIWCRLHRPELQRVAADVYWGKICRVLKMTFIADFFLGLLSTPLQVLKFWLFRAMILEPKNQEQMKRLTDIYWRINFHWFGCWNRSRSSSLPSSMEPLFRSPGSWTAGKKLLRILCINSLLLLFHMRMGHMVNWGYYCVFKWYIVTLCFIFVFYVTLAMQWNFEKFLCNSDGLPVKRFIPDRSPCSIRGDIEALLAVE